MASLSEEYKSKLRNRNVSQAGDIGENEIPDKEQNTEHIEEVETESPKTASQEIQVELDVPLVKMEDFDTVDMGDKLNLLMVVNNKIITSFHLEQEALQSKMNDKIAALNPKIKEATKTYEEIMARVDDLEGLIPKVTQLNSRIAALEKQNTQLMDELVVVKGILQVHDKTININKEKVVDLTARSMENNVVITGLTQKTVHDENTGRNKPENCKELITSFFQDKMKMTIKEGKILAAHRIGQKSSKKPQPMVVQCNQELRDRVFKFTHHLKGIQNEDGDSFYVNPQLLELQKRGKERIDLGKSRK